MTATAVRQGRRTSLPGHGLALLLLCAFLSHCAAPIGAYKAYEGVERPDNQLGVIRGEVYSRLDWINRYDDTIRFLSIDGRPIENSQRFSAVEVTPGYHDIRVYFSWDMGNRRGLAPALVNYAATRETLSRTLRLRVIPGEEYFVKGQPVFNESVHDITTLSHVDFWIEDSDGDVVVSREEGRYIAGQN